MQMNNKIKKDFDKAISNILIFGIVIFVVLIAILFTVDFTGDTGRRIEPILLEITLNLGIGLFVVLIWDKLIKLRASAEDDFVVREIHRALKGLRKATIEDTFTKAASYISSCDEIRVIGTAKQDHWNGKIKWSVDKYLKAIITRINENPTLKYRRLTTLNVSDDFKSHLLACFENNKLHHSIKVILLEDFVMAYTYLIIDSKFLMLSLNYPEQSSIPQNQFCFYTEDFEILTEFQEHFRAVWDKEKESNKEITNADDFRYLVEYQSKASESLKVIKKAINNFPNHRTYFQEHALIELEQTANRFKGISSLELEINHSITNGNLVSLFCIYISMLEDSDTYETITFSRFWTDILRNETMTHKFLSTNKSALDRGAIISRILVVDTIKIDKHFETNQNVDEHEIYMYIEMIKKIVECNVDLLKTYELFNEDNNDLYRTNYDFRVLFSKNHDHYEREFYNFAIINTAKSKEKIIFEPGNSTSIDSTKLFSSNKSENIHRIEDKREKLLRVNEAWKIQQSTENILKFISELSINKNENLLTRIFGRSFKIK